MITQPDLLSLKADGVQVVWAGYTSPLAKLPGPWYSRYTNLVLRYQVLSGRRIFYVDKLHQQYGGVVRIAPNEAAVSDTGGVTQIHKIGGGFLKSDFYSVLVPTDTPGIFAMRDPHAHAARRRLFARAFSNSSLNSNWDVEVRQKVGLAVQKIRQDASGSSQGADIFKWWTLMTTDVIAHLCFGESFNMLELGKVCDLLRPHVNLARQSDKQNSKHPTLTLSRPRCLDRCCDPNYRSYTISFGSYP